MKNRGFTLIELMVAVAIFTIVMMVSMGAVFSVVSANRKSQSLNVVINNLNFAFESMIRDLRTGTDYVVTGNDQVSFVDRNGNDVSYYLYENRDGDSVIYKEYPDDASLPQGEITDPEVFIDQLTFDLVGDGEDGRQLLLRIHLQGKTGNPANNTESTFNIETLIAPRSLDSADTGI